MADITWPAGLRSKMEALTDSLRAAHSALIAFSGGVDSTFLAAVAQQVLGDRALAITARSPTFPRRERKEAVELARRIGIRHRVVASTEFSNPTFACNPADRCYHCKSELFALLRRIAKEEGIRWIADGSNLDDLRDFRPGRKAERKFRVRTPLLDAGFTKADIRAASRRLGLPTADKPAYACLASRIPYGTRITPAVLKRVERAEEFLQDLGFRQVRVRVNGDVARIELDTADIARATSARLRRRIAEGVRAAGFRYVAIDLQGYRTGSMNKMR